MAPALLSLLRAQLAGQGLPERVESADVARLIARVLDGAPVDRATDRAAS